MQAPFYREGAHALFKTPVTSRIRVAFIRHCHVIDFACLTFDPLGLRHVTLSIAWPVTVSVVLVARCTFEYQHGLANIVIVTQTYATNGFV